MVSFVSRVEDLRSERRLLLISRTFSLRLSNLMRMRVFLRFIAKPQIWLNYHLLLLMLVRSWYSAMALLLKMSRKSWILLVLSYLVFVLSLTAWNLLVLLCILHLRIRLLIALLLQVLVRVLLPVLLTNLPLRGVRISWPLVLRSPSLYARYYDLSSENVGITLLKMEHLCVTDNYRCGIPCMECTWKFPFRYQVMIRTCMYHACSLKHAWYLPVTHKKLGRFSGV